MTGGATPASQAGPPWLTLAAAGVGHPRRVSSQAGAAEQPAVHDVHAQPCASRQGP